MMFKMPGLTLNPTGTLCSHSKWLNITPPGEDGVQGVRAGRQLGGRLGGSRRNPFCLCPWLSSSLEPGSRGAAFAEAGPGWSTPRPPITHGAGGPSHLPGQGKRSETQKQSALCCDGPPSPTHSALTLQLLSGARVWEKLRQWSWVGHVGWERPQGGRGVTRHWRTMKSKAGRDGSCEGEHVCACKCVHACGVCGHVHTHVVCACMYMHVTRVCMHVLCACMCGVCMCVV